MSAYERKDRSKRTIGSRCYQCIGNTIQEWKATRQTKRSDFREATSWEAQMHVLRACSKITANVDISIAQSLNRPDQHQPDVSIIHVSTNGLQVQRRARVRSTLCAICSSCLRYKRDYLWGWTAVRSAPKPRVSPEKDGIGTHAWAAVAVIASTITCRRIAFLYLRGRLISIWGPQDSFKITL